MSDDRYLRRIRNDLKAKACPECGAWLHRYTFGNRPVAFKCFKCGYRVDPPPEIEEAYYAVKGR